MQPKASFTRFSVYGLRNELSISAVIKDNTLVLVGENGSGKTTFLRMMFYFLSGRWSSLAQYHFECLEAEIDGHQYRISAGDLSNPFSDLDSRVLARLPLSARNNFREMVNNRRFAEAEAYLDHMTRRYGYSRPTLRQAEMFKDALATQSSGIDKLSTTYDSVSAALGAQILYLPTFRRIERELGSIFRGIDPEEVRKPKSINRQVEDADDFIELVEFGMNDVDKAIEDTLANIKNYASLGSTRLTLSYLGDVVSQNYRSTDKKEIIAASDDTIEAVLNRIDATILNDENKAQLQKIITSAKTTANVPSEHEQIIYHYFTKLLSFQSELQSKERSIASFCELCSNYIVNKKFIYDSSDFSFRIETRGGGGAVRLSDLSSGEKQIVSLFSHLYLSGRDQYFVLIDEPELSLSVPWQRRFLEDIRNGSFCSGLVAVTHSPFIYDNSLRKYTRSLGEFVSGPDWGNIK